MFQQVEILNLPATPKCNIYSTQTLHIMCFKEISQQIVVIPAVFYNVCTVVNGNGFLRIKYYDRAGIVRI